MHISLASPSETLKLVSMGCFGLAALRDVALRLVPNAVPLAIAAVGTALRVMDGDLLTGLVAGVVVFAAAAACWRRGWLGGADVKLFGAGALLVRPGAAFAFVLTACMAGGVLALLYWLAGRLVALPSATRPSNVLARLVRVERRRLRRGGPLPYAVAITAGVCFTLWQG